MILRLILSGFLATFVTHDAQALAARELGADELRENVETGRSRSLGAALDIVSRAVEGETVDVRAFDADGICYRMLIMTPSGQLVSVIVDAATGKFLSGDSPRGQQVREAAKTPSGKSSISKPAQASAKANNGRSTGRGNSGGPGNSGGNGNSGGSSGGGNSGGGNSGGGGGNGGGNGKK